MSYQGISTPSRGLAAPFGTIVSYIITNPGSGYTAAPTLTFNNAGTGTTTGTAVIENGSLVKITFTAIETGITTTDPTVTVAAPGGSGTTATATLVTNRFSDSVDNIYAYTALEAQTALGDAALNKPVVGRGIRVGDLSGTGEDISIVDGLGNVRVLLAWNDRSYVPDIAVARIRSTGTDPAADEIMVFI